MKNEVRSLEDFEKEIGLPARTTRKKLEGIGGRHMSSDFFVDGGRRKILEYIFLEKNNFQYAWKRLAEQQSTKKSIFTIHAKYRKGETYKNITYK